MLRLNLFIVFIFTILLSCISEPKLTINEEKVLSFYQDFYLQKELSNLQPDANKIASNVDITKFALKKNNLSEADLKKITSFYYLNPKQYKEMLEKLENRFDKLFKEKVRAKKSVRVNSSKNTKTLNQFPGKSIK